MKTKIFSLVLQILISSTLNSAAQCTPPVISTINFTNITCSSCCDGTITLEPPCCPPYNVIWSTGETTFSIGNLCSGTYTVTVEYGPGCSSSATVDLGLNSSVNYIPNYLVSGRIFYDVNNNGQYELGEHGLNNFSVLQQLPGVSLYSWNDGNYGNYVAPGNYQLMFNTPPGWHLTTNQSSYNVSVPSMSCQNLDFGIYPDTNSPPQVTAIVSSDNPLCNSNVSFYLNYFNQGIGPASGAIQYTFDPLMNFQSATPSPTSIIGNVLSWNYSDLLFGQNMSINLNFTLPGAGNTIVNTAAITALNSSGEIIDSSEYVYTRTVACSFDPNDKSVNPQGETAQHYTPMNSPLDYTIRFQNTGTAPAAQVEIVDTLSEHLDLNSLQVIGTSHPVSTIINNRTLHFVFDNIQLPDSNENEPASHGYVFYTIKPLDNLPEFTEIKNTANIFFDYNAPITTNTTLNTLTSFPASAICSPGNSPVKKVKVCHGKKTLCVDANAVASHLAHGDYVGSCNSNREEVLDDTDFSVTVFPNPTDGDFTLSLMNEENSTLDIQIYNAIGQMIFSEIKEIHSGNFSTKLSVKEYPTGLYYLKILLNSRVYSLPIIKKS